MRDFIRKTVVNLLLERPTRNQSFDQLAVELEAGGREISTRMAATGDSDKNRRVFSHIIGIERWAQSRLRVPLGDPFKEEEYNGYRPAREMPWRELQEAFSTTRQETLALVQTLRDADVPVTTKVAHNDFGPVSVRGWLRYMNFHANRESKTIK
jgi:hypothetical protein